MANEFENTKLEKFLSAGTQERGGFNLPSDLSPLLGRQEELQGIVHLLSDSSCRLLTLVGPGGVGKTRLGLQVGKESVGLFSDGVFFVPLVSVKSGGFLAAAMGKSLNLS